MKFSEELRMMLKITNARDDLLAARERRRQATKSFRDACANMYINRENECSITKFERHKDTDDDGYNFVITWCATDEYMAFDPSASQYKYDCTSHPDFVAMCAANVARQEANKAHGIALRRLLQIGVKK